MGTGLLWPVLAVVLGVFLAKEAGSALIIKTYDRDPHRCPYPAGQCFA
jgi:hypothetical protein